MIRIAIQTKGRLNEDSIELFSEAGVEIDTNKRKLLSRAFDFPMEVLFLRDDDIPNAVESGIADAGIVGYNELLERGSDVKIAQHLGFGKCRLSLAIPKSENYTGVNYFEGKSIATSYPNILKRFLDENSIKAKIQVIAGSVEIAPAAGMADAIFDIVSSGGTLVSNGLKEVERVMDSEAVLIINKNLIKEKADIIDQLLFRFDTVERSRGKKYILLNIPNVNIEKAISILPGLKSPTILKLADEGWSSIHAVVDEKILWHIVEKLKAIGAEGILVLSIENVIL